MSAQAGGRFDDDGKARDSVGPNATTSTAKIAIQEI
jgi:hypothetical protein